MFGFKKKGRPPIEPEAAETGTITTIPPIFYGGADPIVHFTTEPSAKERKSNRPGAPGRVSAALANKTILLVAGTLIFLLFLGGATWYYIRGGVSKPSRVALTDALATPPAKPTIARPSARPALAPATTTVTTQPTTPAPSPSDAPTTTTSNVFARLGQFPPQNTLDSADLDHDELTDAEEELLGTDSGASDTDSDGYYDGLEVFNLYNPTGFAPVKIIDSGIVREYVNPSWQYRLYYPAGWQIGEVDPAANQVIISSAGGDFVEVRVFDNPEELEFVNWFADFAADEEFSDLRPIVNRFQIEGYTREDELVAYYPTPDAVFVLVYHNNAAAAVAFRQIMTMAVMSFRPGRVIAELPPQPVLPAEVQ